MANNAIFEAAGKLPTRLFRIPIVSGLDEQAIASLKEILKEPDLFDLLLEHAGRTPENWASWPVNRCLWYLRKRLELTQEELSVRSGLPRSLISRLEAGSDPRLSSVRSWLEGLGLQLVILPTKGTAHPAAPWPGPWRRPRKNAASMGQALPQ